MTEPGKRLVPLGAAELSILDSEGRKLALRKPATMTFILKDYIELLGVKESVDAYYFNTEIGETSLVGDIWFVGSCFSGL